MNNYVFPNNNTVPVIPKNSSKILHTEDCIVSNADIALIFGYCMVFAVGGVGNSLVLLVFRTCLKHGSTMNLLIFFLATCDLASSIVSPWLVVYWIVTCNTRWDFGLLGCKIIPTLSRVLTDISIGIILMMAIDRCRAIRSPLKQRYSRALIHKAVGLTVFLSVLCQLYYAFELGIVNGTCIPQRVENKWYSYPLIVLITARTLAFLLIFWITTGCVEMALGDSVNHVLQNANQQKRLNQNKKVMRMLATMAIVFTVTVIPRDLLHLAFSISWLRPGEKGIPFSSTTKLVNKLLRLIQASNCIYNVFIYGKMHDKFIKHTKLILKCVKKPHLDSVTSEETMWLYDMS